MNNYLLQLLKETKTIIIPGLGALTVTNEATGEIMFMSYLKFDDGTLAKHIAEKEGMELNDAKNLIAKFVREVQAEIDKGSTYDMYQFGKFMKEDGEVAFEQWSASSSSSNDDAKETEEIPAVQVESVTPIAVVPEIEVPVSTEEDVQPETVNDSEPEMKEVNDVTVEETVTDNQHETSEVDNKVDEHLAEAEEEPVFELEHVEEVTPTEKTSPFVEETETVAPTIVEEVQEVPELVSTPIVEVIPEEPTKVEVEEKPIAAPTPTPSAEEQPKKTEASVAPKMVSPKDVLKQQDAQKKPSGPAKKKTSTFAYILWGFVVLLLGAGTFVAINFDSLKQDYPFLAGLTGESVDTTDSLATKHIGDEEPAANPDSVPTAEPIPSDEVTEQDITENSIEKPVSEPVAAPKPEPKPVPAPKPVVKPTPKPVVKPVPVVKPTPIVKPINTVKHRVNTSAEFPSPNMSTPYHLIAGSFGSKQNAKNFAASLKAKGMTNVTIGSKDGLFKVSVNGYTTKEEATAALPSLKNVAPSAWVFLWQ